MTEFIEGSIGNYERGRHANFDSTAKFYGVSVEDLDDLYEGRSNKYQYNRTTNGSLTASDALNAIDAMIKEKEQKERLRAFKRFFNKSPRYRFLNPYTCLFGQMNKFMKSKGIEMPNDLILESRKIEDYFGIKEAVQIFTGNSQRYCFSGQHSRKDAENAIQMMIDETN